MTAPIVERWTGPPGGALEALVAESEQQGLRFVRRLVDEWTSGANRFDRPGEALFIARGDGHVVGVCGLNVDPYAADPSVGRSGISTCALPTVGAASDGSWLPPSSMPLAAGSPDWVSVR